MNAGPLVRAVLRGSSGPAVALSFHRLYALVLVMAWSSLAVQVRLLIGERGLLPLRPVLRVLHDSGDLPLSTFPSLFRFPALAGDGLLLGGALLGVLLGLCAFCGRGSRACFAASTLLYLSYATACRGFLAFQWDNLLLECGLLAALLPAHRPAPLIHLLLRVVMFKLYFESGLAKWQSGQGDWLDGSAMTFYYQTSPIPTGLALLAHNLPAWFHHLESRVVLAGELLVPFFLFGPRRFRLGAVAVLTLFQLVNLATANYGFFCWLALALHLFGLSDAELARPLQWLRTRVGPRAAAVWLPLTASAPAAAPSADPAPAPAPVPARQRISQGALVLFTVGHLGLSTLEALERFAPGGSWQESLLPLSRLYGPLRVVNSYHLFASVTRERIEPQIEVRLAGQWSPQHLRYKPGPLDRRPPFVAPHQPRLDFLMWFHGLSWQRRPEYLANLLAHLCHDRAAVAPLFAQPLPAQIQAVRVSYHDYRFTTITEWWSTGRYWRSALQGTSEEVSCDR